ncbi:hypothetical protein [uncultured Aquimarina sp.]|uniref:hypothetical protein n=1 Tax=uncultured Aquimarina sp. TaxID=575652 RepID=UPI002609449F|nr:hypothetical protein [uncultured Aquimarina sp.]
MGLDLSLLAIPKEGEIILKKAELKKGSEYSDILFSLPRAFDDNFTDFGHPDWIEFKNDARNLATYYPEKKFLKKFYIDTIRTYEVFDYIFAKIENDERNFKESEPFFYDGIKCDYSISGQGYPLKYWDIEILQKKKTLIDSLNFKEFFENYNFRKMVNEVVYKIEQINNHPEKIEQIFNDVKKFMEYAVELDGYVLVFKY